MPSKTRNRPFTLPLLDALIPIADSLENLWLDSQMPPLHTRALEIGSLAIQGPIALTILVNLKLGMEVLLGEQVDRLAYSTDNRSLASSRPASNIKSSNPIQTRIDAGTVA